MWLQKYMLSEFKNRIKKQESVEKFKTVTRRQDIERFKKKRVEQEMLQELNNVIRRQNKIKNMWDTWNILKI